MFLGKRLHKHKISDRDIIKYTAFKKVYLKNFYLILIIFMFSVELLNWKHFSRNN